MWHEWRKSANKVLERKSEGNKERLDRPGDSSEGAGRAAPGGVCLRRDLVKTLEWGKVTT